MTTAASEAPSDALIEKIRKALALARDKAATEGEAAAAMEAVSRMLLKYNLSLAEIETGGEDGGVQIKEGRLDIGAVEWRWHLASAVMEHNFCKPFEYKYGRNRKISSCTILGSPGSVEATVMLVDWLFRQVEATARETWRKRTPEGRWNAIYYRMEKQTPRGNTRILVMPYGWEYVAPQRWYSSFSTGAANRLVERLAEIRYAQTAEDTNVTALVVSMDTAIRDYTEKKYPYRKETRERYEKRVAEERARAEELRKWEKEHPEEAEAIRAAKKEELKKEQAKRDRARAAYEDRYYREHGHYPGDRQRVRYVPDTTHYGAYEAGTVRADDINLNPFVEGSKATATKVLDK